MRRNTQILVLAIMCEVKGHRFIWKDDGITLAHSCVKRRNDSFLVTGKVPNWSSEIFSVAPSTVAKQPSIHVTVLAHSIFNFSNTFAGN